MQRLKKTLSSRMSTTSSTLDRKRKSVNAVLASKSGLGQGMPGDILELGENKSIKRLIARFNKKDENTEEVVFSDHLIKINSRGKPQERVIVITNKAFYNLIPTDYKCKRRIPLALMDGLTVSDESDEFVIHVPAEYDYRLMSLRKKDLVHALEEQTEKLTGTKLRVIHTKMIVLKDKAKKKSRRFRLGRASSVSASTEVAELEKEAKESAGKEVTKWSKSDQASEVGPSDFNYVKVVGRGSFGKVLLVTKKGDETKIYAMKILIKSVIIEKNQVEHTNDERRILEEIDSPFLMKMHYSFQTKDKLYMIMDYMRGGELFFHLKNEKRFKEPRAVFYAAEILSGLGHLHEKSIIYRDLKPENILLDGEGHIRLTDFGLSKRYKEGEEANTFCGTPEYLAPEIVLGVGHDKEVDWWSLGILIFEMLVGMPPFYSENLNIIYSKISKGEFKVPSFLSEKAKGIILSLLKQNPEERLGAGKADWKPISEHPFFDDIDFVKLNAKEIHPPFVPNTAGETDTSNFDEEFTSEPAKESMAIGGTDKSADDAFAGFSYTSKTHETEEDNDDYYDDSDDSL